MAIRFRCDACRTPLAVADRKAGAEVSCPKCQSRITVPMASNVPLANPLPLGSRVPAAGATPLEAPTGTSQGSPVTWPDDAAPSNGHGNGSSVIIPDIPDAPPLASAPDWSSISAAVDVPRVHVERRTVAAEVEVDPNLISIPRRLVFVQAGAIGLSVLGAFIVGYLVGRGVRPEGAELAGAQPELIQVRVDHERGTGKKEPDGGAAVLVLPAGKVPPNKIPVIGLRPDQPVLAAGEAIKTIESLGGGYVRGNNRGIGELLLKPGKYQVLVISNQTVRPGNSQAKPTDIATLAGYFDSSPDLLGDKKYELSIRRIPKESPLDVNFGISGR